jgi:hypothetical protein
LYETGLAPSFQVFGLVADGEASFGFEIPTFFSASTSSCLNAEEDVCYTEDETGGSELPPLPEGIPPPIPPPEHLRMRTRAELTSEYFDLLAEKGVSNSQLAPPSPSPPPSKSDPSNGP